MSKRSASTSESDGGGGGGKASGNVLSFGEASKKRTRLDPNSEEVTYFKITPRDQPSYKPGTELLFQFKTPKDSIMRFDDLPILISWTAKKGDDAMPASDRVYLPAEIGAGHAFFHTAQIFLDNQEVFSDNTGHMHIPHAAQIRGCGKEYFEGYPELEALTENTAQFGYKVDKSTKKGDPVKESEYIQTAVDPVKFNAAFMLGVPFLGPPKNLQIHSGKPGRRLYQNRASPLPPDTDVMIKFTLNKDLFARFLNAKMELSQYFVNKSPAAQGDKVSFQTSVAPTAEITIQEVILVGTKQRLKGGRVHDISSLTYDEPQVQLSLMPGNAMKVENTAILPPRCEFASFAFLYAHQFLKDTVAKRLSAGSIFSLPVEISRFKVKVNDSVVLWEHGIELGTNNPSQSMDIYWMYRKMFEQKKTAAVGWQSFCPPGIQSETNEYGINYIIPVPLYEMGKKEKSIALSVETDFGSAQSKDGWYLGVFYPKETTITRKGKQWTVSSV